VAEESLRRQIRPIPNNRQEGGIGRWIGRFQSLFDR
jgi:hypothetical protein